MSSFSLKEQNHQTRGNFVTSKAEHKDEKLLRTRVDQSSPCDSPTSHVTVENWKHGKWYVLQILQIFWIKQNILLKLILPVSLSLCNEVTRKFELMYVAHVTFLVYSPSLDT